MLINVGKTCSWKLIYNVYRKFAIVSYEQASIRLTIIQSGWINIIVDIHSYIMSTASLPLLYL